jgi:hypothetical protein
LLSTHCLNVCIPLYSFVYYIHSPIAVFNAADMRLTDISYIRTVLPLTLLFQAAEFVALYLRPVFHNPNLHDYFWKLFPLWTWLAQELLYRYILQPSTLEKDRLNNVRRDLPAIRRTIRTLCVLSMISWQYTIWSNGTPLTETFGTPTVEGLTVKAAVVGRLIEAHILFLACNIIWMGLLTWDLKAAGMVHTHWLKLMMCMSALVILGGNGAMLGSMWLYREESLATKVHQLAVVRTESSTRAKTSSPS